MAQNIPLGQFPPMQWIQEDGNQMALAMQMLIQQGSFRNGVAPANLHIYSDDVTLVTFNSVAQAVSEGTRLFDAMLYFCIPQNDRPAIVHDAGGAPDAERLPEFLAPRLFCLAFYFLTRGNVPISTLTTAATIVPNILSASFGMNYSPDQLVASLASFDLRNLNNTWIRYIDWAPMSQIARNRVGLGVAGYRYILPFKMFNANAQVQHGVNITLQARDAAYDTARLIANRPYDWNIHPITRDPTIIQVMGPLNPNLSNLMLACFTDAQLQQMVTLRMIYVAPTFNARYLHFVGWNVNMITWAVDPIF